MTAHAPSPSPMQGARLIRSLPGGRIFDGEIQSDALEQPAALAARGIPVERAGPGYYALVAAPGHTGTAVGRIVADIAGNPLPRQVVVPTESTVWVRQPRDLYPGVTLKKQRGQTVALIDMCKFRPKTVRELARMFHTEARTVLSWLVQKNVNKHVLKPLHDQTPLSWEGPAAARRDLRTHHPYNTTRRGGPYQLPRDQFYVPAALDHPIVLPANAKMQKALKAYQDYVAKKAKADLLEAPLKALEAKIGQIETRNRILQNRIGLKRDLTAEHARPVALLRALDLILSTMKQFRGDGYSKRKEERLERLRAHLGTVIDQADDVLITRPVGYEYWTAQVRASTDELYELLHAPDFLSLMGVVTAQYALVSQATRRKIEEALLNAYYLLVASPRSKEALDDISGVVDALMASDPPPASVPPGLNPEFAAAVMTQQRPFTFNSALQILAVGANFGGRTVVNLPGPNSFVVSLLNVAGPGLMARLQSQGAAQNFGGKVFRALRAVARLSDNESKILLGLVGTGTPEDMARARTMISDKWPGRGVGGVLVLLNIAAMLQVWRSNEELTLKAWADLLGSGTGAVLGTAKILSTIRVLKDNRAITSLTRGTGGKALGALGGLLAIASGVETARDKYDRADNIGFALGLVEAGSGTVSVIGFLMTAGAATSWAGVGEVLMLAGVIIGLAGAIWSAIRDYVTEGTERVAEQFIDAFDSKYGPLWHMKQKARDGALPPDSRRRLKELMANHKALKRRVSDTEFWDISFAGVQTLANLDFCPDLIATLTDTSKARVTRRLVDLGQWTAVDQRRCSGEGGTDKSATASRTMPRLRLP